MALTREQYNRIMRVYDERRMQADAELEKRKAEVYAAVPAIDECSRQIADNALKETRALLSGDRGQAGAIHQETLRLIDEKRELLLSHGYDADYLEPRYQCSICRDTGYVGSEKCSCLKKLESEVIYLSSGLPAILNKENFDTFDLDVFDDEAKIRELLPNLVITQRAYMEEIVLPKVQSFMSSFFGRGEGNLLMTGPSGTGKTFLSNCIAREAIERCKSIVYESAAEMFERFSKDSFQRSEDEALSGRIREIYDCELLIIDDLGTELPNSFTVSQFFLCVNERILRKKSTLISSNLDMEALRNIYSERTLSRIISCYTIRQLPGSDIRIRKKLNARSPGEI